MILESPFTIHSLLYWCEPIKHAYMWVTTTPFISIHFQIMKVLREMSPEGLLPCLWPLSCCYLRTPQHALTVAIEIIYFMQFIGLHLACKTLPSLVHCLSSSRGWKRRARARYNIVHEYFCCWDGCHINAYLTHTAKWRHYSLQSTKSTKFPVVCFCLQLISWENFTHSTRFT